MRHSCDRAFMHEKRMPLTKETNNTHKQRTLPNDERLYSEDQTCMKRILTAMPKNGIRWPYAGLCGTRVTRPLCS